MSWQRDLLLDAASVFPEFTPTAALPPHALVEYLQKRGVDPGVFEFLEKVNSLPHTLDATLICIRAVP